MKKVVRKLFHCFDYFALYFGVFVLMGPVTIPLLIIGAIDWIQDWAFGKRVYQGAFFKGDNRYPRAIDNSRNQPG